MIYQSLEIKKAEFGGEDRSGQERRSQGIDSQFANLRISEDIVATTLGEEKEDEEVQVNFSNNSSRNKSDWRPVKSHNAMHVRIGESQLSQKKAVTALSAAISVGKKSTGQH